MSEHSGYPGAPPGWYPDPAGGPGQRWWNGYAWTEATVLPSTATATATSRLGRRGPAPRTSDRGRPVGGGVGAAEHPHRRTAWSTTSWPW